MIRSRERPILMGRPNLCSDGWDPGGISTPLHYGKSTHPYAGCGFSPWLWLRTRWRRAKVGITATMTFFVALFGCVTALALTFAVFLIPFCLRRSDCDWGQRASA